MGIARVLIEAGELANSYDPTRTTYHEGFQNAKKALGNAKVLLNLGKIPGDLLSLSKRIKKIGNSADEFRLNPSGKVALKTGVHTLGALKKIMGIGGDLFFKPVALVNKCFDLGTFGSQVNKAWKVVALVKSGTKLVYYGTDLLSGTKKVVKRVLALILEAVDFIFSCLNLARINIDSRLTLTFTIFKTIYGLYQVWAKTA